MFTKHQTAMVKHGLIIFLVGLIGGFFFMFSLVGSISFTPLPFEIDYELPGGADRWRAVHTGNMMNGLMAILFAVVSTKLSLTDKAMRFVAIGTIMAVWGNAIFYIVGIFAPNHGITLGDNRLGEANWAGVIAFIPAYIVALLLIAVTIIMIRSIPKP